MTKTLINLFLVSLFVCLQTYGADRRPNIILCMADDQGWEEVGYYGHSVLQTPTLDKMAASGLRLDRFYSAAPNCGPTRGSIMTGRHPNRFGLFGPNWAMRPEEITLGRLIKSAGYSTGHFGKWHLGPVKAGAPNNPGAAGFDEWLSHDNFFEMDPVLVRNGAPPEKHLGESSKIVVDAAIDFIRRANGKKKPFFTIIWFGSPHGPYIATPKDFALYQGRVPDELAHRYGEITAMDRAIGSLREVLREEDVADNTLFWFCSDNGVPGGSTYRPTLKGAKGALYEGGVRVPGIIEWPSRIPFQRTTTVRSVTTDIFPTLCELLKIKLPKRTLDGISLVDLINGKMHDRPSPIAFWKFESGQEKKGELWLPPEIQKGTTPTVRNPGIEFLNYKHPIAKTENFGGDASLLSNQFKLILSKKGGPELYDLKNDWSEVANLAEKKPELVETMTKQLHAWQASVELSLSGADY
jgi:arylsulfatase A-like enzyme